MFTKTVDKVVSTLSKAITDLQQVEYDQRMEIDAAEAAIITLQAKQNTCQEEAARAARVRGRLEELLN